MLTNSPARLALATAAATAVGGGLALLLGSLADQPHWGLALLRGGAVTAVTGLAFLAMARVTRLSEVTEVVQTVARRVGRAR